MSRERKTRVIEEAYYEIKCDFCEQKLESRWDNVRTSISHCDICGKDFCREHGKDYYDNIVYAPDEFYPEISACQTCIPVVEPVWEWAQLNVKKYESIGDVVKKRIKKGGQ